jgi:hypothetical protein
MHKLKMDKIEKEENKILNNRIEEPLLLKMYAILFHRN